MQWEQLSCLNLDFPSQSQPFDLPIPGYGSRNSKCEAFSKVEKLIFGEGL